MIRVGRGYLRAGDTLTIRLGDRRQGSPGFRLQTNVEANVELRTAVDAFATYEFCELPVQPSFDLVPGPGASWKAILPSLALVGKPFRLAIVAEDKWGNPTADANQAFELQSPHPVRGLPARLEIKNGDGPRVIEQLVADAEGDLEIRLTANGEEFARAAAGGRQSRRTPRGSGRTKAVVEAGSAAHNAREASVEWLEERRKPHR